MSNQQQVVTIYGQIVRHDEPAFWGRITISLATGLITRVERGEGLPANYTFRSDCLIFAGYSDIHIHAREDETGKQMYKEDYTSSAAAALNGGVVCVGAMPNTPNPLVSRKEFGWHRARIEELDLPVVIFNYVGISTDTQPIHECGRVPYKLFFGKSVGDLTITYASELERALARYRREYVSFHVEYEPIVQAAASGKTHSDRRPVECVNEGLRLLLPLIEKYQIKAKLCHWSTGGESFELIEEYRSRGCDITLEVSPLHLIFDTSMTDEDVSLWMKIQMNPAVQAPEHRRALIEGLRTGFIDFLATDHAPHTEEEKYIAFAKYREQYPGLSNKEIALAMGEEVPELFEATCVENNTSGAPWLDTFAVVCAMLINECGFTPQEIARVAAFNPGRFASRFLPVQFPRRNFGRGLGDIVEGYIGNLTILNTQKMTTVDRKDLKTKVGWSPLEGWELPGCVEAVFIAGELQ